MTTAATNYLHGGRAPATTYTYRVASVDASGNLSPPSAPATVTTPSDGAATELALAAAALEPGEWVELETMGLDDGAIFATDGGGGMIEYMTEAMWDPIGRRAFIMGTARGSCTPICYGPTNVKWVQWSELTNGWTRLPFTAFYPGAHTYEHAALNPRTGDYYMRVAESSSVYHLPVGGSAWMPLPNLPIGASIANSLQYFPDMEALVFIAGRSTGDTAIFRLNDGASSWERLAESADLPMGNYHDFGEYSAVHNVMFFGGGTIYTVGNQRNFYELDADGNTRRLADLPFAVGVNGAITVAEPNTGNLLVFSRGAPETFAEYIYTTDSWVTHEMPDDFSVRDSYGSIPTVAAPIPEYGVIIFFKNAGTGSRVMLYRHRSE